MDNFTSAILSLGSWEDSDLEASSDALVHVEVVDELTSAVELLDLGDERDDVTAVASAAAVFDLHQVVCIRVALFFVWLRLHNSLLLNINSLKIILLALFTTCIVSRELYNVIKVLTKLNCRNTVIN